MRSFRSHPRRQQSPYLRDLLGDSCPPHTGQPVHSSLKGVAVKDAAMVNFPPPILPPTHLPYLHYVHWYETLACYSCFDHVLSFFPVSLFLQIPSGQANILMVFNMHFLHIWGEEIRKNSQEISGTLIFREVFHSSVTKFNTRCI